MLLCCRDFTVPVGTSIVTKYSDILDDPSINVVVELMGGVTHAKDVVFGAIKAGKHVVTANKALIAAHLSEIQGLLKENPSVRCHSLSDLYITIIFFSRYQTDKITLNAEGYDEPLLKMSIFAV